MSGIHKSLLKVQQAKVVSAVTQGAKFIGTHNGTFHCDEALAVSLLKILPRFESHAILRTRDLEKLSHCEAVVDVGGEYDFARIRLDHHQKTFTDALDGENTKLSSAGLVYKHFGRDILQTICDHSLSEPVLEIMYKKLYKGFVEHIDGIDNGVEVASGPSNYAITTSLSARVGYLNPRWNESQSDDVVNSRFHQVRSASSKSPNRLPRHHHLGHELDRVGIRRARAVLLRSVAAGAIHRRSGAQNSLPAA
ncbi:hypothetical protein, variant 2 [Aphanomyces astaci]|uniref:Metal-dependent protein hydrolase n=1 Tax=Aphanomyces astaci TaxID=112090 RepID=W4H9M6_APHAT|nr:hypothetical protein, variant 2 [Aphanomyces astaci]ETV88617.1 hypothetical protein, variant 2 [Aphanomyces astaci]|eukprot:XP_009821017.1 hypothetical protein, variant 2 [Aphanomyces astaci]